MKIPADKLSTASLDYLQRVGPEPRKLTPEISLTRADPRLRRITGIASVGQLAKYQTGEAPQSLRLLSEDLLIGLYGYKIPLVSSVSSDEQRVGIQIGTWSPNGNETIGDSAMDERRAI